MDGNGFAYQGSELEAFARATTWKRYVAAIIRPHLGRRVLEVGAGIGANVAVMDAPGIADWLCLEPDGAMAERIARRIEAGELPGKCRVVAGTIDRLAPDERFDTILYIDVLEHIGDDAGELRRAAAHLAEGGRLVVLSPAHQFLFSPFDAAIGHFRRYGMGSLRALTPPGYRVEASRMLDCAGFFASLANKMLLRRAMPTAAQIGFWDRVLVRLSRVLDRLTGFRFGKTVVVVWGRGSQQV